MLAASAELHSTLLNKLSDRLRWSPQSGSSGEKQQSAVAGSLSVLREGVPVQEALQAQLCPGPVPGSSWSTPDSLYNTTLSFCLPSNRNNPLLCR